MCLIYSPDSDFTIKFCRAAEYVSVLCWEQRLNSVFMGLKLLLNFQALRVQHKDLPHNLAEAWPTTTTNPDLERGDILIVFFLKINIQCVIMLLFHCDISHIWDHQINKKTNYCLKVWGQFYNSSRCGYEHGKVMKKVPSTPPDWVPASLLWSYRWPHCNWGAWPVWVVWWGQWSPI